MKITSPKYSILVETAQDLFMRYGIKRVTIEEICSTSGVSKMTFYKYFRNKNDLAMQIIKNLIEEGMAKFNDIMAGDLPIAEKMDLFIKMKLEYGDQISNEFYADFVNYSPEIHDYIIESTQSGMQVMMESLERGKSTGEIRPDLDLRFLTYILNLMPNISNDQNLIGMFPDTKGLAHQVLNLLMYGILGGSKSDG